MKRKGVFGFYLRVALLFLCQVTVVLAHNPNNKVVAPVFDNIGKFHWQINTSSPQAQRYFDQGMTLFYSFESGEAIRSFTGAIVTDPKCGMCYWGLALALGSKTNMPLDGDEVEQAQQALLKAKSLVDKNNAYEIALIKAQIVRFKGVSQQPMEMEFGLCSAFSQVPAENSQLYAQAMSKLAAQYPKDANVLTICGLSLFFTNNWAFWDPQTEKAIGDTNKIIQSLERAIKIDRLHPGANHLYVHVMEFSPLKERALSIALTLPSLSEMSEHLAHMPSHTYYVLGQYDQAISANLAAIKRQDAAVNTVKAQGFKPVPQYLAYHNYDYLIAAASMAGNKAVTFAAAETLDQKTKALAIENPLLQRWQAVEMLAHARFSDWQFLRQYPEPQPGRYCNLLALEYE